MISWAIAHSPYIGMLFVGYAIGVVHAAAKQIRQEKLDRWLDEQRRVPPPTVEMIGDAFRPGG